MSEKTLDLHGEYLRKMKLKYSILEKSIPQIAEKNMRQISKMRLKDKKDILNLNAEIKCHELYFSSFGREYESSREVKRQYRSEASFLYDLFESARKIDERFVVIYFDRNGCLKFDSTDVINVFVCGFPLLCIDLCEHAYFLDYGFDREAYLTKMLHNLNLSKIDKFLEHKD